MNQRIVVTIQPMEKQRECFNRLQAFCDPVKMQQLTETVRVVGVDKTYGMYTTEDRDFSDNLYNALLHIRTTNHKVQTALYEQY